MNKAPPSLCSATLAPQSHPGLVLLTGQIHHLAAFSCDLLTSCWLVFSSQWPIAVSLVVALLKRSREPDNARQLYMSPVSSPSKNGTWPLHVTSACLQWGATLGEQRAGEGWGCVSIPTGGCDSLEIMWSEGVWTTPTVRGVCSSAHSHKLLKNKLQCDQNKPEVQQTPCGPPAGPTTSMLLKCFTHTVCFCLANFWWWHGTRLLLHAGIRGALLEEENQENVCGSLENTKNLHNEQCLFNLSCTFKIKCLIAGACLLQS